MNLTVGYIPYLNMVPFHQGFGPEPVRKGEWSVRFERLSPRALGLAAEAGLVDAGAMSLVDTFRLAERFEPLGNFGIGVKYAAGSVLLFSRKPLAELEGMCAVTDETATSFRLLQVLLEKRYGRSAVSYGRVASSLLFDGGADALLLIGDEALRARREGVKDLPVVTDLAAEWYAWQGTPFVFARWMVRRTLPPEAKSLLHKYLDKSLKTTTLNMMRLANQQPGESCLASAELEEYWNGFCFRLAPPHARSMEKFRELAEALCLTT